MGNSKSKTKTPYLFTDQEFYDYDNYLPHPSPNEEEIPIDFDKLPTFTLPEYLKEAKKTIEDKKIEFEKKKTFDV